jgi:hypothetical protein
MNVRSAVTKIEKRGMVLIFPINNRKEPASLWSEFFPRTEMRWEWDEGGDNRVGELWHLRERLSVSRKVVYTKWFRGRATAISFELFTSMLAFFRSSREGVPSGLTFQAREMLDVLDEDSPQSTKALKRAVDLQGRENERVYNSSTKQLWSRLLIVGFGEVDEGAFPSLAIGSTKVIFEELWEQSRKVTREEALKTIDGFLPKGSVFRKYLDEVERKLSVDAESDAPSDSQGDLENPL